MLKRVWGVVLLVLMALLVSSMRTPQTINESGLSFEPGSGTPWAKEWTATERTVVLRAVKDIRAHPLGDRLWRTVSNEGKRDIVLRRYSEDVKSGREPTVVTRQWGKWLEVFDRFFECRDRDPLNGSYELGTYIVLHELFHVLDGELRFSKVPEFLDVVGFTRDGSFNWKAGEQSKADLVQKLLWTTRDCQAQMRLQRQFGVRVLGRLPSYGATGRPREAFADIGAHLILDPKASEYTPATVRVYFDRAVFAGLSGRDGTKGR
jgi:hypothetical protein